MKQILALLIICCMAMTASAQLQFKKSDMWDIPCTAVAVPGMQAVDTTAGRSMANNYLTWENGDTILVKFMNGSTAIRNRVMQYAKEWERYGNIFFKFVPDTEPFTNIRVKFGGYDDRLGHNSRLGVTSNDVPQHLQTLNLDTSDFIDIEAYKAEFAKAGSPFNQYIKARVTDFNKYTMLMFFRDILQYPEAEKKWNLKIVGRKSRHEFGHALGLLHEQSYPGGIKWNRDTVYKYYASVLKWTKEQVDFNVLEASDQFFTNGTVYDPLSVMHYDVKAWQTLDGYSLISSMEISEGDKKIMAALYPKDRKVSTLAVPKIQVLNFKNLDVKVDNVRKGLVIQPSFDLKTSAVLGKVHFVAILTSEDGKTIIKSNNQMYSWNNWAATYMPATMLPSSNVAYNKGIKKNLELFFPFKEMPPLNGMPTKVRFFVYLFDVVNNKYDRVAVSSLSNTLALPTGM